MTKVEDDHEIHMRQMLECIERYCGHVLMDHMPGEDWGCAVVITRAGTPEATILCAVNTSAFEVIEGLQYQEDHQEELVVEQTAPMRDVTKH